MCEKQTSTLPKFPIGGWDWTRHGPSFVAHFKISYIDFLNYYIFKQENQLKSPQSGRYCTWAMLIDKTFNLIKEVQVIRETDILLHRKWNKNSNTIRCFPVLRLVLSGSKIIIAPWYVCTATNVGHLERIKFTKNLCVQYKTPIMD